MRPRFAYVLAACVFVFVPARMYTYTHTDFAGYQPRGDGCAGEPQTNPRHMRRVELHACRPAGACVRACGSWWYRVRTFEIIDSLTANTLFTTNTHARSHAHTHTRLHAHAPLGDRNLLALSHGDFRFHQRLTSSDTLTYTFVLRVLSFRISGARQ